MKETLPTHGLTDMATSGLSSEPTNDCDRTLYHARGQCDGETMKKSAKSVIYSVSHFRALGTTTNFIHYGTPHVPPSDRPVEMGNQVHTYLSTLEHAHTHRWTWVEIRLQINFNTKARGSCVYCLQKAPIAEAKRIKKCTRKPLRLSQNSWGIMFFRLNAVRVWQGWKVPSPHTLR